MGVSVNASNCSSLQSISDPSFLLFPHWARPTANFANCFELDLPKILHEESCRESCANIIFPGSEIPKWFAFQNTGSYITLDQSLDWLNENFLGFLTCFVVSPTTLYQFPYYDAICYFLLEREDGKEEIYGANIVPQYYNLIDRPLENVRSDHVLLSFHSIKEMVFKMCEGEYHKISSQMKSLNCKVLFKFYAEEVKKCGIHFLYVEDYGEPSETSRRSVDNTKRKRKRKRKRKEKGTITQ
ncbi:hypothetical protein Patl1_31447 [Pistacia atlantica]|uniref:Uncharacterized protein n=1 Tax=Pistacia atlantica TaxID=434234 RepID=A0ACC1AR64_9ROSI|nr:hypothetical protein Patl1_31447 [Pistacia atlantica]